MRLHDAAINPKRLGAVPWAEYCIRCQEAADRREFETETTGRLHEFAGHRRLTIAQA
jgi:RNA polymerase-binding transcription factor DksA